MAADGRRLAAAMSLDARRLPGQPARNDSLRDRHLLADWRGNCFFRGEHAYGSCNCAARKSRRRLAGVRGRIVCRPPPLGPMEMRPLAPPVRPPATCIDAAKVSLPSVRLKCH